MSYALVLLIDPVLSSSKHGSGSLLLQFSVLGSRVESPCLPLSYTGTAVRAERKQDTCRSWQKAAERRHWCRHTIDNGHTHTRAKGRLEVFVLLTRSQTLSKCHVVLSAWLIYSQDLKGLVRYGQSTTSWSSFSYLHLWVYMIKWNNPITLLQALCAENNWCLIDGCLGCLGESKLQLQVAMTIISCS